MHNQGPKSSPHPLVPRAGSRLDWLDDRVQQAVKAALAGCPHYGPGTGGDPSAIELIQTHISSVFITPEYVFKFKRPVDLGFADFTTLSRRRRFCRAEVRLNSRLAPDVYLEVLPLRLLGEGFGLNTGGRVVDYCVVMRHLPSHEMLDRRLAAGQVPPDAMERLARLLARFHGRRTRRRDIARYGSLDIIRTNIEENFSQVEPFIGRSISQQVFQAIRTASLESLERNAELFRQRAEQGRIKDGHGDLRCEHIHLNDDDAGEPRVIDCIEFNDRFRFGDVANDLAFLLMDLTAWGHQEMARLLLDHYLSFSRDRSLERLVAFYACYRAFVRGKVTSFKLNDRTLPPDELETIRREAARFFELAHDFARQMEPPVLLLVAGLMGTGKSTLCSRLREETGWAVYNSDEVRKELLAQGGGGGHGAGGGAGQQDDFGQGLYSQGWNDRTYRELYSRAADRIDAGHSVILDASFASGNRRDAARRLARERGARLMVLECRLAERATLARLAERQAAGESVSDGRVEIYHRQKAAFEPIREFGAEEHLVVDTADQPETLTGGIIRWLAPPPPLFGA
ncbi:MAG: AAA family ATPase [Deltaproteobacteria bacterium]|nr:AAA family ATPase [Deltaproteobacteria bacterium]